MLPPAPHWTIPDVLDSRRARKTEPSWLSISLGCDTRMSGPAAFARRPRPSILSFRFVDGRRLGRPGKAASWFRRVPVRVREDLCVDAADLIARLQEGDITLYDLSPQEFEEVVAELLASMGWQVSPTPPGRDRGLDIIGISKDPTGFESTWLVECKRYAPDHRVDAAAIRQLSGVKLYVRAAHALLVTSSSLTAPAAEAAEETGINVADATTVSEWIGRYAARLPHLMRRRERSVPVSLVTVRATNHLSRDSCTACGTPACGSGMRPKTSLPEGRSTRR